MRIATDRICRSIVTLILAAAGACALGAEGERRYALHEHGSLRLMAPQAWLDEVRAAAPRTPPTIVFRPLEGDRFLVLITPIWRPEPEVPLPNNEVLRERIERGVERARSNAVEKEIRVWEFAGASGPGFYFSATDRAQKQGEFAHLTQGMLRVGELVVMFTILSDSPDDVLLNQALNMLKSAEQVQK